MTGIKQSSQPRFSFAIAALLAASCLSACETVDDIFQRTEKAKIKGERVAVLNVEKQVVADPALAATDIKLPAPYANDDWTQPGGTSDNAMHHLSAKGELVPAWRADGGIGSSREARLMASPVIGDGRIYVLDAEANVSAFGAETGQQLWKVDLTPEDIDSDKGFGGGVAYDQGRIYVSTGFGFVVALDAASGQQIWKYKGAIPFRMAPVVSGGRVFASTQENQLFALATNDGRVLWDHRGIAETASILRSNSVAVEGDLVVVPYSSGELFALRADNGRALWSDTLSRGGQLTPLATLSDIASRPVIDRGQVYAISHSGRFVAINERTGERVWTIDIGGTQRPWVAGDYVYAITDDARVICVTRKEGKIRWSMQLPAFRNIESRRGPIVWSGPILASDRLIALSSRGKAVSISPYTGEILGQLDMPDGAFVAPIVARETLYILTDDADLFAFR
jgi:outer membrane protein assembly factor BamB